MNESKKHDEGCGRGDKCECLSPWRYDERKTKSDIDDLERSGGDMWKMIDSKLSVKAFGVVITLLVTCLMGIFGLIYDTNMQTLALVTQINKDVIEVKAQQQIINKFIPAENLRMVKHGY